jgi:hypothetical protein
LDVLSDQTVPQIRKEQGLERAFEQVLNDPSSEQALKQPALRPLLEQAADSFARREPQEEGYHVGEANITQDV